MSVFGWITGSSETASKVVDAAIATGDKLFYTDEEKAEGSSLYRDWYLKYLEATQPQNIARRLIAIAVTFIWVLIVIAALIVRSFDNTDLSDYFFNVMDNVVNPPFMIIIGFYFLKHVVSKRND